MVTIIRPVASQYLSVLGVALALCVPAPPTSAAHLAEVISSLYGGDGITLFDSGSPFTHVAHFQADALVELGDLASALSDSTPPLPTPATGGYYEYDPITEEYRRAAQSNGSLFAETSETLGPGRFLLSVVGGHTSFDSLNGVDLDSIQVELAHEELGRPGLDDPCVGGPPGRCYAFQRDYILLDLDIELETSFVAFAGIYGVTQNLDLGFQIPLLYTKIAVHSQAELVNHPSVAFFGDGRGFHFFDEASQDASASAASRSNTGLGDLRVFAKYNFFRSETFSSAARVEFRIPTGDENNLQGLEGIGSKLTLIADSNYGAFGGTVSPHINIIASKNSRFGNKSTIEHIIGANYSHDFGRKNAMISVDIKGRHTVKNQDGFSDHQYDIAVGGKLTITNTLSIFGNAIMPLNDAGLRSDLSYIFGIDTAFP